MNLLFVVPYAPTPIRVRPYNLLRSLLSRGHRVTLATLWESEAERLSLAEWQALGVEVLAAPLTGRRKLLNLAAALPSGLPLQAAFCRVPSLGRQLRRRLALSRPGQDGDFDVAHVEHLRGSHYALHLRSLAAASGRSLPVVWDSVDCIGHLFEQAARHGPGRAGRLMARFELRRTRRYESSLVRQFDRVLVTSEVDRRALQQQSGSRAPLPITVLTNGVDLEHFAPPSAPRPTDTLVFSGKMSYHANAAAALYLTGEVMPRVWQRRPSARLVIAGSRPPAAVREAAATDPNRVTVTGYVPEMRLPLQQAAVAVAPMLYGAGIQNKVLEAMACATPVVASPLAVSALSLESGRDCLLAATPDAFAHAILALLDDDALRCRLGAAGRRYVEEHHNWNSIAQQLEAIYLQAVAGPVAGVARVA